jgi:hypothetical protein
MGIRFDGKQGLREGLEMGRDKNWLQQIIQGVPEGSRHTDAIRLVGRWYGLGLCTKEVRMGLEGWNQCNLPPLSPQELESIIKSTEKWENPRLGGE